MGLALLKDVSYESVTCCICGVEIFFPASLMNRRRENHTAFWCVNGHEQSFTGKTEAEKLRVELEAQKRRAEMSLAEANEANKLRRRAENKLKRVEKRTANGVCPCCSRHFTNLERHMTTKHPEHGK
jgi:hypothetical protein